MRYKASSQQLVKRRVLLEPATPSIQNEKNQIPSLMDFSCLKSLIFCNVPYSQAYEAIERRFSAPSITSGQKPSEYGSLKQKNFINVTAIDDGNNFERHIDELEDFMKKVKHNENYDMKINKGEVNEILSGINQLNPSNIISSDMTSTSQRISENIKNSLNSVEYVNKYIYDYISKVESDINMYKRLND